MCPRVGPHAPSFGRQLWGLPSSVEYLSPQGVLLSLVYGTTAPPLWLELRGHSAWQATPSWTVYRLACHWLLPWLRMTFAMLPDAVWLACAVSRATWLLFTGAPAPCVALRARCPGSLGSCSPVCLLCLLFCLCGVRGHLAPVHRCACAVCWVVSALSWATWLLMTGVPTRCVVLRVWCPGPLGPRSTVCPLGVFCCVCGVLGHLAPVHWCARSVCSSVCFLNVLNRINLFWG